MLDLRKAKGFQQRRHVHPEAAAQALLHPVPAAHRVVRRPTPGLDRSFRGRLLFIGAAAAAGIAMALYPVLRRYNEGLALGSVCFRLIEGALYIGVVVCVLLLVSLSQEFASGGATAPSGYEISGSLLMAARDSLGVVAVLAFGLGGLMYYSVFYQSRLVPRWLSAWGLLAAASVMSSSILVVLDLIEPMSTTQIVMALPILLQEMALAAWLIAKGFNASAIAPESADGTAGWRAPRTNPSGSPA